MHSSTWQQRQGATCCWCCCAQRVNEHACGHDQIQTQGWPVWKSKSKPVGLHALWENLLKLPPRAALRVF